MGRLEETYKLAANTISRLIAFDASSIFLRRVESPMIRAAFRSSRQVSSNRTIVRTIEPSGTSVSSQISANGVPCKDQNMEIHQFPVTIGARVYQELCMGGKAASLLKGFYHLICAGKFLCTWHDILTPLNHNFLFGLCNKELLH